MLPNQPALRRVACGMVWLCLLTAPQQAASRTESASPGAWPERVYRWYYNPQHAPLWLSAESARALVEEASKPWLACGVRMAYQGEISRAPGKMDQLNVVGWSLKIPPQLRGMTTGRAQQGQLRERDIAIRADRAEFERSPQLLQKVITHEFGHAIGLTHSARCDDVMTLAADCPKTDPDRLPLVLTAHDLARCLAIYPP